ncbi:MAG TPA: hypothetical protein VGR87_05725 [Candidatus Limnocylindria bacterium]|jgi:hypothetical protein|nr:hypothetical protein [Candidatus Limnocylindria bacterium]
MKAQNGRDLPRFASAGAVVAGIANLVAQAVFGTALGGPDGALVIASALAPTLAILVAWWVPSRALGVAMLCVAMLLELPALVAVGSGFALAFECLLLVAVIATYTDRPERPRKRRELSIVF